MTSTLTAPPVPPDAPPASDLWPRLLPRPRDPGDQDHASPSYEDHLRRLGPPPPPHRGLISEVDRAGLRGRGGAAFPTGRKMAAVAERSDWTDRSGRLGGLANAGRPGGLDHTGRPNRADRPNGADRRRRPVAPILVANATEGEPLSVKDRTLLLANPHLVLDGMEAAAGAIGANRMILCVERDQVAVIAAARRAFAERPAGSMLFELALTPNRYVAGQETALVNWLNGGDARPTFGARPFERGVGGRPTLVDNVETLAHLALIARFGADWFRRVGTSDEPGSMLVTLAGAVTRPGVLEVPIGYPLEQLLTEAGAAPAQALLIGGYFGTWLAADRLDGIRLSAAGLAAAAPAGAVHARLGCGLIAVIPRRVCALAEVAAVAEWYAANSAGQCGACVFGLADIAGAMRGALEGVADTAETARRWAGMVRGGGACQLPDGAAGFVESALDVFAGEAHEHQAGRCSRPYAGYLPAPAPGGWQ